MSLPASFKLGFRQGALRTSSLQTANIRLSRSDARLFSSLLAARTCTGNRSSILVTPAAYRQLSLWGSSSKPAPTSESTTPAPEVPTSTPEEATSAVGQAPLESALPPADATSAVDPTAIVPSSVDSTAVDTLTSQVAGAVVNHVPAALQYGDLAAMGLAGWTPAGLIRWSFELINATTGMPWFWTIVAGTAFWRLACVPLAVKGMQASARLQPHQAELMAMQAEVKKASAKKDPMEMQKASLMMREFYKKHEINPLGGLISLIQLPITLGIFFGVQKLCSFPVEQLKWSGVSFLPDLTAADPTYLMPLALCALINMQIYVGAKDINTIERPDMGHFMNAMRILTIPGVWFMSAFPSGLLLSLMTTAVLTTAQSLVLRLPAIRHRLGMPITPPESVGKLPSFKSSFLRAKSMLASNTSDFQTRLDKARREAVQRQRQAKNTSRR